MSCGHVSHLILFALAFLLLSACNFSGRPEGEPREDPAQAVAQPVGGQGPGVYSVFPGDTVYGVAQRFGVPVRTLIETNALQPPFRLVVGQRLRVPVRPEHMVQSGDTLLAISRIYGVDQSSLVRANNLAPPYGLRPGQRLVLPGRVAANVADLPPAPAVATAGAGGSLSIEELPAPATAVDASPTEPTTAPDAEIAAIPESVPRERNRFLWPVKGKVVSRFGAKTGGLHNDGINIAASPGATVVAAESGVVAYAGNELRGFGNLLLIRHAEGWVTAYAHNEKLLVKRGDKVKRGQAIARVGSSGNVASPQLHFEIRKGTDPVDPLRHMRS